MKMKTTAKQFTAYGNIGLVQIRMEPESGFSFRPGGPEMKNGGLVINEANEGGVVGKLIALNVTDSYLLLTDADVLVGAKQNRIINMSVLLSPGSKTVLDVSCIERLRWQYTDKNFSSPDSSADHDLRKAKAASMSFKRKEAGESVQDTQGTVWEHISSRMSDEKFFEKTESYHAMASFSLSQKAQEFPVCNMENGCNGLAVVADGRVQCIDIFGTEEVYKYYFPLLRDSAFRMAKTGKNIKSTDLHEAYYKVLDTLDGFDTAERKTGEGYNGAGLLTMAENNTLIGFDLTMEGQIVHRTVFSK
jgi:hypothetical protein